LHINIVFEFNVIQQIAHGTLCTLDKNAIYCDGIVMDTVQDSEKTQLACWHIAKSSEHFGFGFTLLVMATHGAKWLIAWMMGGTVHDAVRERSCVFVGQIAA
jgi:hypothetical protein